MVWVKWIGIAALVLLAVWIGWSYATVAGVAEPKYTVIETKPDYEIRRYNAMLLAETEMNADGLQGNANAFRTLAGYIFGGNTTKTNVEMTAPVLVDPPADGAQSNPGPSTKIEMTAPVLFDEGGASRKMAFVLPERFTLATAPKPTSDKVTLREVPARTLAALTFSGYGTDARRAAKSEMLLNKLKADGYQPIGTPLYAGYNPPMTFPLLRRNEIMIEIVGTEAP